LRMASGGKAAIVRVSPKRDWAFKPRRSGKRGLLSARA
jgi:hypothetical protein